MDFNYLVKIIIGIFVLLWGIGCNAIEFNGLHINGFLSQGYLHTNHNDYLADTKGGTFDYNEIGLNLGYQLTDSFRLGGQVLSRNLGVDGNNKFTFGYLYGDYNLNRYIGLRGGKIRIPMGLYNQTRDADMLRTGVFLPNSIYRDEYYTFFSAFYGAEIYGELPLGAIGSVEYELFGGQMDEDDESWLVKNNVTRFGATSSDMTADESYGGALRWSSPHDELSLGYSYLSVSSTLFLGGINVIESATFDPAKIDPVHILSAEYTWKDIVFASEYMRRRYIVNADFANNTVVPDPGTTITTSEGWYFSGIYRYNDLFEFGIAYSEFYQDKNDKKGEGARFSWQHEAWLKDLTLSARFNINDYWLVKAEYHVMDGTAWLPYEGVYGDANSSSNIKQKWNMIALKTTFSF